MDTWLSGALCSKINIDTQLFYHAETLVEIGYLRTICNQCLVRINCRDAAIANDEEGFWGGMTEKERDKFRFKKFLRESPLDSSPHKTPHEPKHLEYAFLSSPSHISDEKSHNQQALYLAPVSESSSPTLLLERLSHQLHEEQPCRSNQKNRTLHSSVELKSFLRQLHRPVPKDLDTPYKLHLVIPKWSQE